VIKWTGPVADLDHSGDPYLDQFIHGRAEGPIEAERRAIAEALAVIRSGWDTVLADPDAAGGLVDRTDLGLPGAVVTAALPRFNAEYVGAADAADRLDEYFRVLFAAEPRAIGGALPDDDIYLR
jgi:hypothetical protein